MKSAKDINSSIWERLYSQGKAVLQYPDSTLISIIHHLLDSEKHKRILDYGFGSGSNMLAFLRRGFICSGVEVSENAIQIASERMLKESFNPDLKLMRNGVIPFKDSVFDAVIAWGVLYYNDWNTFSRAVSEINRVLRVGGLFIGSMMKSDNFKLKNTRPLGNSLYERVAAGQEGAIIIAIDNEKQLSDCFPGKKLSIGKMGFDFNNKGCYHWIVSYEK